MRGDGTFQQPGHLAETQIDPIIVNNYMDLSVRFQMAEKAIEMHSLIERKRSNIGGYLIDKSYLEAKSPNKKKDSSKFYSHNECIQVGILIKAYGQLKNINKAFQIFEDHQKHLAIMNKVMM